MAETRKSGPLGIHLIGYSWWLSCISTGHHKLQWSATETADLIRRARAFAKVYLYTNYKLGLLLCYRLVRCCMICDTTRSPNTVLRQKTPKRQTNKNIVQEETCRQIGSSLQVTQRLFHRLPFDVVVLDVKKGCLSASLAVIRLSGFRARHCSSKSMKWLRWRASASFIPVEAALRRVRRSRVGLTTAIVLIAV